MGILFYLFAIVTVLCCISVISAKNSVYAVLSLILSFFSMSGLFLLLGAEYLAMTLVIVYVGAVAVLFLFVVMMLNIEIQVVKGAFVKYLPIGIILTLSFIGLFILAYKSTVNFDTAAQLGESAPSDVTNTMQIAQVLYTDYFLSFQLCGLILFVAMVGAIVLTVRHSKSVRRQSIFKQTFRTRSDSIELKDVKSGEGVEL